MSNNQLCQLSILDQQNVKIVADILRDQPHNFCYVLQNLLSISNFIKFLKQNVLVMYYIDKNIYNCKLEHWILPSLKEVPAAIQHLPKRYCHLIEQAIRTNYLTWLYCYPKDQVFYDEPRLFYLSSFRQKFPFKIIHYQDLQLYDEAKQKNNCLLEIKCLPGGIDFCEAEYRWQTRYSSLS